MMIDTKRVGQVQLLLAAAVCQSSKTLITSYLYYCRVNLRGTQTGIVDVSSTSISSIQRSLSRYWYRLLSTPTPDTASSSSVSHHFPCIAARGITRSQSVVPSSSFVFEVRDWSSI